MKNQKIRMPSYRAVKLLYQECNKNRMNHMPVEIYQEFLSWLKDDDQRMFAMVNRMISSQLLEHVRVLVLQATLWDESRNFERKFQSYLTSEKHQRLIADPFHQLILSVPDDYDLKAAGIEDINISCKSLSISAEQLITSFMPCIKKVQNLTLCSYSRLSQPSITDSELQVITDWMNNSNLGLKHVAIRNYNIKNLPVISSLESLTITESNTFTLKGLNISSYSNLRYLRLSSDSIADVSSLDGIHELHLEYCGGIRNISCLNHNYKIVISDCDKIIDYSNCFRYSKIIDIWCPDYMREEIISLDLSKALEAREIYFYGRECTKSLLLPQSSSLHFVQAENLLGLFALPSGHRIREITVRECGSLTSLLNFDSIYSVKLANLDISTLEGLGSGNRVVEVDTCPLITDFSVLRHCDKVTIQNCQGFKEVDQVRGVKDLILSTDDVDILPKDMEGVTCLILPEAPENLFSLTIPSTLNKLVFSSANIGLIKQLPLFLASLPYHVGKIEVSVDEKTFRPLLKKVQVSIPNFIIEFKDVAHFLRKFDS